MHNLRGLFGAGLTRQLVLWSLPRRAIGAEIGVFDGDFSARIIRSAKPRRLYLIDPWAHQPEYSKSLFGKADQLAMDAKHEAVLRRFASPIASGTVEVIRDYSDRAVAQIEDGELDFLYIDGLHTYDGVRADLANYYPKVRVGGLIVGDDYRLDSWWGDGVVRAFNEFIGERSPLIRFKIGAQIAVVKQPLS